MSTYDSVIPFNERTIMAIEERETVVVNESDEGRSAVNWIIALIALVLLLLAFFYFGGYNALTGAGNETEETDTINVDTPDTVEVEPNPDTNQESMAPEGNTDTGGDDTTTP
jgi:hypothetical protein